VPTQEDKERRLDYYHFSPWHGLSCIFPLKPLLRGIAKIINLPWEVTAEYVKWGWKLLA